MTAHRDAAAMALARLRQSGWLPSPGLPLAEVEERASRSGREIVLIGGVDDASPIAVLGWQGADPAASPRVPRLARRELSRRATKTLVIVYALLTDPQVSFDTVTTEQVLTAIELVTAKSGKTWVIPALHQELTQAGLLVRQSGGWALGPMTEAWDLSTRDVMAHAAGQLQEHPRWPGTRSA